MFPDGAGNGFPLGGILGGGGVHMVHMGSRFEIWGPSADAGMALKFGGAKLSRDRHASLSPRYNFYFHGVDVISMRLEAA